MRVGQKNKLTYRWARKGSRPRAVHDDARSRPICSERSARNSEPVPPWCCPPATARPCSSISMRSPPRSLLARMRSCCSIRPAGTAPRFSTCQATSRSCRCRHAHPNSTARKTSGNSCGRTGSPTACSNPTTTSSITAATPGTPSSISHGRSCPSHAAIGLQRRSLNMRIGIICIITKPFLDFAELSREDEDIRSQKDTDPLLEDIGLALDLERKPEGEWSAYEKRRIRRLTERISRLRGPE